MSIKRGNIVVKELDFPWQPDGDLVKDFVKARLPEVIRTTTGKAVIPAERRASVALSEAPEVTEARIAFLKSLSTLKEKHQKHSNVEIDVALDPRENYDWSEVIQALRDAEKRYLNVKNDGPLGQIRNCLRKFEAAKGGVESWLRILPSESWQGSLVCGGLKVIVGVAAQIGEIRDLVIETIEQIPLSIETAVKLHHLYQDEVLSFVTKVLAASFHVMKECIDFFKLSPARKMAGATFRGKDYGKGLKEKLAAMKRLQEQMNSRASLVKQYNDHDSQEVVRDMAKTAKDHQVQYMEDRKQWMPFMQLTNTMVELLGDQKKRQEEADQLRSKTAEIHALKWMNQSLRVRNSQLNALKATYVRGQLLNFLAYEEDVNVQDKNVSLQIGNTLSADAQNCASTTLYSEQVQQWLGSEGSGVLVINAMERTGLMRHSTASYFSSLLLISLSKVFDANTAISWFCGQHIQETDLRTMLRNLVGQLLSTGPQDLQPEELELPMGLQWNCQDLTNLLMMCLRIQLRRTPVFCVLDSISWYEDYQRVEDLFTVWSALARLARDDDPKLHPLKVLATSPSQCSRIGTQIDFTKPSVYWARHELPVSQISPRLRFSSFEVH